MSEPRGTPPSGGGTPAKGAPACGTCRFWDFLDTSAQPELPQGVIGICRQRSPQFILGLAPELDAKTFVSGIRSALWPTTSKVDWCGDWRRKT